MERQDEDDRVGQSSWSVRATAIVGLLLAVGLAAIVAEELGGGSLLSVDIATQLGSLIDAMALAIAVLTFTALSVRNRSEPDRLNLVTASVLAVLAGLVLPIDLVASAPDASTVVALAIATRVVIVALPLCVTFRSRTASAVELTHLILIVLAVTAFLAASLDFMLRFGRLELSQTLAVALGAGAVGAVLCALRLGALSLRNREPRGYVLALTLVALAVADGHASMVESGSLSSVSGKAMRLVVIGAILVYTVVDLREIIVRDRERAMSALNASERAADRLVSEMSFQERFVHDTRNALLAIQGGLRSMESGTDQAMVHALSSEVNRLRTLLEGDDRDPLPTVFDVVHALSPMVSCYQAGGHEVRLTAAGPMIARGRPSIVAEVAQNLIENALVYGGGTEISIWIFERQEHIEVRVADRGAGVDLANRDAIFDRGTTGGEGSGVGLSIARRLIEQQGGTLDVEDRHGGGSIFAFTLPRAEAVKSLELRDEWILS